MANLKWSEAYKGEYNSETSYVIGNFVTYNGSCYTCIANSTGNLPTNTSYWKLVSSKGDTGPQGPQGIQGIQGDKGGGLEYSFSTNTTDSDPGQGIFKYNNATIASVTQIFIDILDDNGIDVSSFIDKWDDSTSTIKGYLFIVSNSNSVTTVNIWQVNSVTTETGYRKIGVSYISGSLPTNNEKCIIGFYRTGDAGNVSGPASSTDNAIVLFNGTTGGVIKDSGKTLPSGDVVGTTDTQTLTNKKINPRQSSTTSTSSLTPDKANYDEYYVTALSENITINNATSPSVGNTFVIYLTDDGTSARTISFGNHYAGIGSALPTTTTKGKTMEIIIKYVTNSIALVSYSEKV